MNEDGFDDSGERYILFDAVFVYAMVFVMHKVNRRLIRYELRNFSNSNNRNFNCNTEQTNSTGR